MSRARKRASTLDALFDGSHLSSGWLAQQRVHGSGGHAVVVGPRLAVDVAGKFRLVCVDEGLIDGRQEFSPAHVDEKGS